MAHTQQKDLAFPTQPSLIFLEPPVDHLASLLLFRIPRRLGAKTRAHGELLYMLTFLAVLFESPNQQKPSPGCRARKRSVSARRDGRSLRLVGEDGHPQR